MARLFWVTAPDTALCDWLIANHLSSISFVFDFVCNRSATTIVLQHERNFFSCLQSSLSLPPRPFFGGGTVFSAGEYSPGFRQIIGPFVTFPFALWPHSIRIVWSASFCCPVAYKWLQSTILECLRGPLTLCLWCKCVCVTDSMWWALVLLFQHFNLSVFELTFVNSFEGDSFVRVLSTPLHRKVAALFNRRGTDQGLSSPQSKHF